MMKLSLLTRNFHDQLCEKVVLDNNILSIYIYMHLNVETSIFLTANAKIEAQIVA